MVGYLRDLSDASVGAALAELADTGVWRRAGEVLHQTDLGYEFTLLVASLKEGGLLDGESDCRWVL